MGGLGQGSVFRRRKHEVIASRQRGHFPRWPQHGWAACLSAGVSGPAALSDFCWPGQLLNKCTEAAGDRDKAPLYLHRLNSRINLSPLPLQPSPRFFFTYSLSLFSLGLSLLPFPPNVCHHTFVQLSWWGKLLFNPFIFPLDLGTAAGMFSAWLQKKKKKKKTCWTQHVLRYYSRLSYMSWTICDFPNFFSPWKHVS